jgi:hypothetical protein
VTKAASQAGANQTTKVLPGKAEAVITLFFDTDLAPGVSSYPLGLLCGKQVTLPDNSEWAERKSQSRWNRPKYWMLAGRGIRAGGHNAIPLSNIGSMGGECGPLPKPATEKAGRRI